MAESRRRSGLALMFLGTACFVCMAAFIKSLRESGLTTSEVIWWRMAPALLVLAAKGGQLRARQMWPVMARSVAGLGAAACYFYALRSLTLIENAALHLLQPVFVAVLAPIMLKERLHRTTVAALSTALVGAVIVIRPDRAWADRSDALPVVAGVAAAVLSAIAHVMIRRARRENSPESIVWWYTAFVAAAALAYSVATGDIGLPTLSQTAQIVCMASLGLGGQMLMTVAYGRDSAPRVAVVAYASIPMSIAADLAWAVVPGASEIAGSVVMICGGILLARGRPR